MMLLLCVIVLDLILVSHAAGDMSFVYGNLDDEDWTRALKCMLANIKWVIAWYSKHQQ